MWPWRRLRGRSCPPLGQPGQAQSLRAVGNRSMSPISATSVMAVSRPTPGRTMSAWTRGRAWPARPSGAPAGRSGWPGIQQPAAVLDDRAWDRRQLEAGQPRPPRTGPQDPVLGDPTVSEHGVDPVLARVERRTRAARWRSSARRSPTGWGVIQASGSRSAPSSRARVAAATWSFLSRAAAIALQRLGCTSCGSSSAPPATPPASPSRRPPRTPPACLAARCQGPGSAWPDRGGGRGCAGGAGLIHDGDRGALAMHVHPDVDTHQVSFPELDWLGCRAEQGMGPDPHSVRSEGWCRGSRPVSRLLFWASRRPAAASQLAL
jgi:hypothetical protein